MIHYFSEGVGGYMCIWMQDSVFIIIKWRPIDFPGSAVAKTPLLQRRGTLFDPGLGNQIIHATTKSLCAATEGPACLKEDGRSCVLQLRCGRAKYIYIQRERERETHTHTQTYVFIHTYTHRYIYIILKRRLGFGRL